MQRAGLGLAVGMALSGAAMAEGRGGSEVAAVNNKQYLSECSACHMAYPPGLLPARSWQKLMGNLSNHFGDDASMAAATQQALTEYLLANAADNSDYRRSRRIARSIPADAAPLRISEVPYIQGKHDEIPARYIGGNPQVRSLSNCAACHVDAAQGNFSEHGVRIPGVRGGGWDDDD